MIAGFLEPDGGKRSYRRRDDQSPRTGAGEMSSTPDALFPTSRPRQRRLRPARDGTAKPKIDELVAWALDLVRMPEYEQRRASELSVTMQRVALARALVKRPLSCSTSPSRPLT